MTLPFSGVMYILRVSVAPFFFFLFKKFFRVYLSLTGWYMVEFLRSGPVPYSHPVGNLSYHHSFNHQHTPRTPKYKSPSPGLSLVSDLCVQLSVSHLHLDVSKPPQSKHVQRQMAGCHQQTWISFSKRSPQSMTLPSIKLQKRSVRVYPGSFLPILNSPISLYFHRYFSI